MAIGSVAAETVPRNVRQPAQIDMRTVGRVEPAVPVDQKRVDACALRPDDERTEAPRQDYNIFIIAPVTAVRCTNLT